MAALVSIEYKQSIFFQSDPHTVIANKLVFTGVDSSNYTLKGLRSDKPWHKHDSNKYHSKAFLICHHQHLTNQKLCKIVGLQARVSFSLLPLPLPRSSVFLPSFQLSQWTRVETLATQANLFYLISPQSLLMFTGIQSNCDWVSLTHFAWCISICSFWVSCSRLSWYQCTLQALVCP